MNVSKSNLVAILLEVGEENAAVLLARSKLPDEIDLQRDLESLGRSDSTAIRWTKSHS